MLCSTVLIGDRDFDAFGLTSCTTSADEAGFLSVVGLGPSKDKRLTINESLPCRSHAEEKAPVVLH